MAVTTRTLLTSGPTVLIYPTSPQHRTRSILITLNLVFFAHILSEQLMSNQRGAQYEYCYDSTFTRVECPSPILTRDVIAWAVVLAGLVLAQRGFYEVNMGVIEGGAETRWGGGEVGGEVEGES